MGVYLPNIDMPKDDKCVTIEICPDGSIWQKYRGTVPNAKAIPVPPHGDLIDRDALYTELAKRKSYGELSAKSALRAVANAPTIIQASEEGE